MGKRDYLLTQLDEEIKRFGKDSITHKKMYRAMRYAVFTLTAASTGLAKRAVAFPQSQSAISLAIVFISAAAGVVSSIEGLRKPAELWIHERATHYALKDLKRELEFRSADQTAPVSVDEHFSKMQAILGAAGDKWNRQIVGAQTPVAQPIAAGDASQAARL